MILNDRQLVVTRVHAANFEAAIASAKASGPRDDTDPVIHAAFIGGMESQLETLRREIRDFLQEKRHRDGDDTNMIFSDALRTYRSELQQAPICTVDSAQIEQADRCLDFLSRDPLCFERSNPHGHFTGSGLIVDPDEGSTLLVHHVKYDAWVQTGGHCDGIADPFFTAWEEAFQETGLKDIRPISPWKIADIHIQPVAAYGDVPEHLHYDIRYWFRASSKAALKVSHESRAIVWVKPSRLLEFTEDDGVFRLVEGYFGRGSVDGCGFG